MSISDEITRLTNAKAAIKQSIVNKGVRVSDSALLDEYPALIDKIEGGGEGGGSGYENPDFYELLTNGGTNYNYLFYNRTINNTSFIESLDTSKVTDMRYTFYYFKSSNLDLSGWDVSKVKGMNNMFDSCNVPELNVTNWNSSQVTNMDYMFQSFTGNITGLNTLNTSNVTTMQSMFKDCKATTLDLSNWDVSNVTDMEGMFNQVYLEILDISGWDTSNVKDFGSIYWFVGGIAYNAQTKKLTNIIGTLDLSSCTSGMYYSTSYSCFKNLSNLESVYLKNIYKNVTTMKNEAKWSINLGDTIVKDECLLYIINELPDLINDKKLTATDKIVFTLPPTNTLTQEQVQVAIDKGWQVANTTY